MNNDLSKVCFAVAGNFGFTGVSTCLAKVEPMLNDLLIVSQILVALVTFLYVLEKYRKAREQNQRKK